MTNQQTHAADIIQRAQETIETLRTMIYDPYIGRACSKAIGIIDALIFELKDYVWALHDDDNDYVLLYTHGLYTVQDQVGRAVCQFRMDTANRDFCHNCPNEATVGCHCARATWIGADAGEGDAE